MPSAKLLNLHHETVHPDWVDYNGHMNVAYYFLVFDHATDTFLDEIGLDARHREETGNSVFVAEAHVTYEKEVMERDRLHITTQVLDADPKCMHIFHRMYANDSDEIVATNELMILGIDLAARRVAPLAAKVASNLNAMQSAHSTLPHPYQAGSIIGIRRG